MEAPTTASVLRSSFKIVTSDEFRHISLQANATADNLLKAVEDTPLEEGGSKKTGSHKEQLNSSASSIGILDLNEEDASFDAGSEWEQDFIKKITSSSSDSGSSNAPKMQTSPKLEGYSSSTHNRNDTHAPSLQEIQSVTSLWDKSVKGWNASSSAVVSGESSQKGNGISSPLSSPTESVNAKALTLELQNALHIAEQEVSQLRAQVYSKTESLEMAQQALMEYEDEVHTLRAQLKDFEEGMEPDERGTQQQQQRQQQNNLQQSLDQKLSHENFVRDLKKVKSGTHRIRLSLGENSDETGVQRLHQNYQVLKESYEQLNVQKTELELGNEDIKAELEKTSSELKFALGKLQQCKERNEELAEEKRVLKKERDKLRIAYVQAQDQLALLCEETPDADKEVTQYRQRLKESRESQEKLQRDLECMKTEVDASRAELKLMKGLLERQRSISEQERIEQANEERVLQLREVLNSKLREHPDMLKSEDCPVDAAASEGSHGNTVQDAAERIHQLQEALSLALEAKALLEEKVASKAFGSCEGLRTILEDIGELKENFQKERRMALRERTENENIIMNLQQEKEELLLQTQQVTIGLTQLQKETQRVQEELVRKRQSSEEFRIEAEERIRELERENAHAKHKLAQVREALDLCLEAKRELEIRVHQSDIVLSEWVRTVSDSRMQEEENFTALLRRRIDSGNVAQMKQAALQAIEHLERLQEETQKRLEWSTTSSVDIQCDTPSTLSDVENGSQGESSRMLSVTSHQLRMLRKDLREVTHQRDEALSMLKSQKATDARRFNEIQELQRELNSALDQYERLLPQFHEVINAKKEMENKVQQLLREIDQHEKSRVEMESAVKELVGGCQRVLSRAGFSGPQRSLSLVDSILWTKTDMEEYCNVIITKKQSSRQRQKSSNPSERSSHGSRSRDVVDLKPLTEQMRCMVDKERELKRFFDSQSGKLTKLKADTEQRSQWICRRSSSQSTQDSDYPATEMQLQERSMALKKLSQKEEEISGLLAELNKTQSLDQDMLNLFAGLENLPHARDENRSIAQSLGDRLNRLQECAGALEEQLIAVKNENKQLKAERKYLLTQAQLSSTSSLLS